MAASKPELTPPQWAISPDRAETTDKRHFNRNVPPVQDADPPEMTAHELPSNLSERTIQKAIARVKAAPGWEADPSIWRHPDAEEHARRIALDNIRTAYRNAAVSTL